MKKLLVVIVIMVTMVLAQSHLDLARKKIDRAYNQNDEKAMFESRALFERLLVNGAEKGLINYYIAYCDYRLYTYQLQKNDKKEAKAYLKDGIAKLKNSLEYNEKFGEAYALMSSFYGGMISLNPISGMWNGPKSQKLMADAMDYSSSSPRIFLLDGISKFHTPKKFGGGVKRAIESLEKAIILYNEQDTDAIPSWGKTDAYTWMGIISAKQGETEKAKNYYEKALAAEPENSWVKYVLLPDITK